MRDEDAPHPLGAQILHKRDKTGAGVKGEGYKLGP